MMHALSHRLMVTFVAVIAGATSARAEPRHGLSVFGDLKYPADFKHFDYVNPDAPKGGRISLVGGAAIRTFDSFNSFILKGDSAQGLGCCLQLLMSGADDEPSDRTASSPGRRGRPDERDV